MFFYGLKRQCFQSCREESAHSMHSSSWKHYAEYIGVQLSTSFSSDPNRTIVSTICHQCQHQVARCPGLGLGWPCIASMTHWAPLLAHQWWMMVVDVHSSSPQDPIIMQGPLDDIVDGHCSCSADISVTWCHCWYCTGRFRGPPSQGGSLTGMGPWLYWFSMPFLMMISSWNLVESLGCLYKLHATSCEVFRISCWHRMGSYPTRIWRCN